jgi:DNA-directed RNA polymerase specialized sigma24 family protein
VGLLPETRFDDWTRRDVGSFAKRYFEPLWRLARHDLPGVDESRAQDLAQAFLLRELERTPLFERFVQGEAHAPRFRAFLRTCFYRFCRDELEKERRRAGRPLEGLPEEPPAAGASELERLVARDLVRALRARVVDGGRAPLDEDARRYLERKWPDDLLAPPRPDLEVARALGLTRARVRTLKRRVVDRLIVALRAQLRAEGLGPEEVEQGLAAYVAALGREDGREDGPETDGGEAGPDGG